MLTKQPTNQQIRRIENIDNLGNRNMKMNKEQKFENKEMYVVKSSSLCGMGALERELPEPNPAEALNRFCDPLHAMDQQYLWNHLW